MRSSRTDGSTVNKKRGFARLFEGWEVGLLAVFVAGVPAYLAVPRSVSPVELPEPMIAPTELRAVAERDRALASQAERERLDTDVRALGSRIRAFDLADASDDTDAVAREHAFIAEAAARARAHGVEALERLRAFQLESFLRELRRWEATGDESEELLEVAGPFLRRARTNGWVEKGRLHPDESVRAALFKKRWAEVSMVSAPELELAPVEQRALLGFLLRFPPHDPGGGSLNPRDRVAAIRVGELAEQYRLKKIQELRGVDPSFPADLALGVVYYRTGRYLLAVEAFRRHVDDHPDGPNAIRARNYLRAALERASDMF